MEPKPRVEDCLKCLHEEFEVPVLLDADDVIAEKPDEKALMTYSALIRFHFPRILK